MTKTVPGKVLNRMIKKMVKMGRNSICKGNLFPYGKSEDTLSFMSPHVPSSGFKQPMVKDM